MAQIKLGQLYVARRADYLPSSDPDVRAINAWYVDATNAVLRQGGGTGYEQVNAPLPSSAVVDETGTRVCRVCGVKLVKKPGKGRWPAECRTGEGCKVVEPVPMVITGPKVAELRAMTSCALCGCGKGMKCECGKVCGHPTHKVGA
jgi:hypothetical protein